MLIRKWAICLFSLSNEIGCVDEKAKKIPSYLSGE